MSLTPARTPRPKKLGGSELSSEDMGPLFFRIVRWGWQGSPERGRGWSRRCGRWAQDRARPSLIFSFLVAAWSTGCSGTEASCSDEEAQAAFDQADAEARAWAAGHRACAANIDCTEVGFPAGNDCNSLAIAESARSTYFGVQDDIVAESSCAIGDFESACGELVFAVCSNGLCVVTGDAFLGTP